ARASAPCLPPSTAPSRPEPRRPDKKREGRTVMASDLLLDSLHGLLTPEATNRFAATTGESESTVSRAVGASAPIILGGLLQRSGDPGVMRQVMNLVTDRSNEQSAFAAAGGLQTAGQRSTLMELGQRLLALVFGDRQATVVRSLAESC